MTGTSGATARPDGGPPNDWTSQFKAVGPAWTFDEVTGQWYLHSFMAEQPDLDWDNPEVEAAMHDVIRFWMDRGVDGLRLDAIHKIAKDPVLRDHVRARCAATTRTGTRSTSGCAGSAGWSTSTTTGWSSARSRCRTCTASSATWRRGDQLHLAHNFVFVDLPWDCDAFRTSIDDFEALADRAAWPAWFLSNHDTSRAATRFGGAARARASLLILYALRGTPFIYQGEELGLPDAEIPPGRVVDVDGRDPERAPMPWTAAGPAHGFSDGEPWLPFVADAAG